MAPRESNGIEWDLPDEAATTALAARLAGLAAAGDVFALDGELGCGKTVFARAFIAAKCGRAEEVPSPTFTLLQTYDAGDVLIYHFDLYRLSVADEALELGIEEAFADGISLIEWPERLGGLMPRERLDVALSYATATEVRRVALRGHGGWCKRLAEAGLG